MNGAMLLPEFDYEMASTRKVLERIPEEHLGFKPHDRSWTLLELAGHVATLPWWDTKVLTTGEVDVAEPYHDPEFSTKAEVLAEFDENVARARVALEAISGEELMAPWTMRMGEDVVFSLPRAGAHRSFIMNHGIQHRGQLTVYLRLVGAPVPAIYGPSADEES